MPTIPLAKSESPHPAGATYVGKAHPLEPVAVTVYLESQADTARAPVEAPLGGVTNQLTHAEFEQQCGASQAALDRVIAFGVAQGLRLAGSSRAKRCVNFTGPVKAIDKAFKVELAHFEHPHGRYRSHEGPIHIPAQLAEIVTAVVGLDDQPVAEPFVHYYAEEDEFDALPAGTFAAPEVAGLYNFPAETDGSGQCIGLIQMAGGYRASDLNTFFQQLDIPQPEIITVGPNRPSDFPILTYADREVALDIEIAGALAPGAKLVVYFAEEATTQGFINIVKEAINDKVHRPSVLSISWGGPEEKWPVPAIEELERTIRDGARLGITTCVAAGDWGAHNGHKDGRLDVNVPASSPSALSCGGTRLSAAEGQIIEEVVWNSLQKNREASGGGVSSRFRLPPYQENSKVPPVPELGLAPLFEGRQGRGVPDVAGNADPETGYRIFVKGKWRVGSGTSAVAPLWAALIARLNQSLGKRIGFANPWLYTRANTRAFNQITQGANGYYQAQPGWDACTGNGSPNGVELLASLSANSQL